MEISSLAAIYQAKFFSEIKQTEKNAPLSSGNARGDTVNISEEALALSREAATRFVSASGDKTSEDFSENREKDQAGIADNGTGVVINGMRATEKDIYAQIQKTEEEVAQLTTELEQIMGLEVPFEEKIRLSEPTHKNIQDKYETLSALRSMAEAMKMNRAGPAAASNPLAGV